MFLSGGGVYPHVDPRRTSVAAAVDFAAGSGLQGVVLNTAALQWEPGAVEAARNRGLRVMTYGAANDSPEWVRRQFFLGVQGVIVDDVAGVAAALSAALG
jgi:glycerophosphodiester phosphodiesterase